MTAHRSPADDPRWVYRPMIDLIGRAEGTAQIPGNPSKARGYNTTLGYDAYTGGPVDLVSMTLDEVDALQTRMLGHPNNRWNSSAVGWMQIVRKTLRSVRAKLKLSGNDLFDEAMQDRLTCFLLGYRGIDKWLHGKMAIEMLVNNLAMEWASFPASDGTGWYSGQSARIAVDDVRQALSEVRARHFGQITQPTPQPPPQPSPAPPVFDQGPFGADTADAVFVLAKRPADELARAARMIALAQAVQGGWSVHEPAPSTPRNSLKPPKETTAMTGTKSLFQSKTIIGIAVAALSMYSPAVGGLLNLFGLGGGAEIDPAALEDIKAGIEQLVAAVGLIFAAWGRVQAKTTVTLTGRPPS
jgi:muramidase (phage lysozyme)